jgi:diaminopimelate epimerase
LGSVSVWDTLVSATLGWAYMACMTRPFVKMNGAGNDFVVVNALDQPFAPSEDQIRALGDRQTGEGFDQLIAIEPSDTADAFMRVWNADGSMVETCGNALRCVGWLLLQATDKEEVVIDTLGGPTTARRAAGRVGSGDPEGSTAATHQVTVDMGAPRLDWSQVPLSEDMDTRGIELQIGPIHAPVLHTPGAVSMGNPHVVFFTDRLDDAFVRGSGSLVEHHPLFPEGVNVGFADVRARDHIRLRVWERGAGLTLACGTGACAALVASARRGLTDRKAAVTVDGGELTIDWDEASGHVFMTGPVEIEGTGFLPAA